MNKLLVSFLTATLALVSMAAQQLMPGSINFNNPALWGKEVRFGLDDNGGTTGQTRWYQGATDAGATIRRYSTGKRRASGYLNSTGDSNVHRTIGALNAAESTGPMPDNGQLVSQSGVYVDTRVTLSAYKDPTELRIFDSTRDKINCWICIAPGKNGVETNFMVTAGSATGAKNYVTDAKVTPGTEFRLMIRAVKVDDAVGFEVYVDDVRVRSGATEIFPSMLNAESAYASRLYSLGVAGVAKVDRINFTKTDPREDPEYDQDDVSMLREYAEITVSGYDGNEPLYDFPLLVKIAESGENAIKNFHYSRCAKDGSDLRFTDENGKLLSHEIDTWNPEGESLIWVRVPYLCTDVRLRMHWSLMAGAYAPANEATDVWKDYIAVWHFNENGYAKDSTGHGFVAKVDAGGVKLEHDEEGPGLGAAGYVPGTNGSLVAARDYETFAPDGNFTFTGWFLGRGLSNNKTNPLFGTKYATGAELTSGTNGWCGALGSNRIVHYHYSGNGSKNYYATDQASHILTESWFHIGMSVTGNETASLYLDGAIARDKNGATFDSVPFAIEPTDRPFQLMRWGLSGDELRLSYKVRSAAWIKAEYAQATTKYLTITSGNTKDRDNYWVVKPSLSSVSVAVDELASFIVDPGTPRYGTAYISYQDSAGTPLPGRPSEVGSYKAIAIVPKGVYDGLRSEMPFVIYERKAYRKFEGSDRVMLFNSDESPSCPIALQGYYDVDAATNNVWEHIGGAFTGVGRFVEPGDIHIYHDPTTQAKLWEFRHARMGNLFQEDEGLPEGMNFLPWGGYANRFTDSAKRADAQRYAGTLILQNISLQTDEIDPAAAYSPFYTKGVGTVYFDAVNNYRGYHNVLKLQMTADDYDEYDECRWTDVRADVFAITNGSYCADLSATGTTEIVLAMTPQILDDVGTTNYFYRIRAQIDTNAAVRLRIVRNDTEEQWTGGVDDDGLISIDNIIVSYPAMGISLSQYGAPAEQENLVLRGQRAPFDVAFPAVADLGSFHTLAKVNYIANNTNTVDSSFVASLVCRYRWRYLNQSIGDWNVLLMSADGSDPTRFISNDAVTGEGYGDIEYSYEAIVNAPFYEYWDYSGLAPWAGKGSSIWPDLFTERRGNVAINAVADGVYSAATNSPALGTDYFIRLREGRSDYEGFRLHVRRSNGTAESAAASEEVFDMQVSSDHTWRGFYPTLTNGFTNVYYRIEAYNHQAETGCDYQWTTNWYTGIDQIDVPVNDVLVEREGWARLPCDELTGYLLFQIEDTTKALTVIHADYQNFNAWTDALTDDACFVGTSQALPTSGVSRTARSYTGDFLFGTETIATNGFWREPFNLTGAEVVATNGEHAVDIPFIGETRLTPNSWTADSGMWVCEKYRVLGGKSLALQLANGGLGVLTMNKQLAPRGVDTFKYRARVAQSYSTHPFNFYTGSTNDVYSMESYTFAVPCAMKTKTDGDFEGVGTLSAVARYRDSKGGYEARVERTADDQVSLSLYKWDSAGVATLLGTSGRTYTYGKSKSYDTCGFGGVDNKFGAIFISCTNTPGAVRITAGILSQGQFVGSAYPLSGCKYFKICYEDTSTNQFRSGTCGVGSKECPATFARPLFTSATVPWSTSGGTKLGSIWYWTTAAQVTFPGETPLLNYDGTEGKPNDYDNWNVYTERLPAKSTKEDIPVDVLGFKARVAPQQIIVETTGTKGDNWKPVATNVISTFGFAEIVNRLYISENSYVRLHVGKQSGAPDVVVDDLEVSQWRGENFNEDGAAFPVSYLGSQGCAETNFVYTSGWLFGDGSLEISPMRTTANRPAGVRSPLMDGGQNRGLGLGMLSFSYLNADKHTRLIVQVYTNNVDLTGLASVSTTLDGWSDVKTYTFEEKSEDELASGTISCYIGAHGVKGVMRVIIDPTLVEEARDTTLNPRCDPSYGRIYIIAAGAKDNPALDSGSWWGWNLRTTDDGLMQLLCDGDKDVRLHGLSYALNNSVDNDTRPTDVYNTHKPFLQTPILTRNAIGEITFKARKYLASDHAPSVAVYGMKGYDPAAKDGEFTFLTNIVVNSVRYENYAFQVPVGDEYTAFRLAVTGVDDVIGDGTGDGAGPAPASGYVRRVLIDEVAVFESIRARLGFCHVGAFRNHLADDGIVPTLPDITEQPMCNESWGIQAELYAVRLSEKIDYNREPVVMLHWFEGRRPWGYENWRTNTAARSARLTCVDKTNLVYRSHSLKSPDAVIPMSTTSGTIVQYSLDVIYYMEGQPIPLTNTLSVGDWDYPSWFHPINYNSSNASNGNFAAFNILDDVAPGWAWFNEVNIVGVRENGANTDKTNQYIEVAAPAEANLTGWSIRLLTPNMSDDSISTNTLAIFGRNGLSGTKTMHSASNMVFHVIGSPLTRDAAVLTPEKGTLDGAWGTSLTDSILKSDGELQYYYGMGLQLVRKSGIIEHEIVAIGTNLFAASKNRPSAQPTNVVNFLNRLLPGAQFFYAGADEGGIGKSLGVFTSQGEISNVWNNVMRETPGYINADQFINPDHPTPNGSLITVYANIMSPKLYQTIGAAVRTNENQIVVVRKGSELGTNITYHVDEWYELASVGVTEGGPVWNYEPSQREVTVTVAKGCSNNTLTVSAYAQVDKRLRDLGCDETNPYTPAIIDWLEHRSWLKDVYGLGSTVWPDSDGNIYLADFMGVNRQVITNMTLTQMYWLDICPTISNQCLVAGMVKPPLPDITKPAPGYEGEAWVTNVDMNVLMMLTNRITDAESPYYGKAWAPYVIRGLDPGSTSSSYGPSTPDNWTNVSFKITGLLANGYTSEILADNWVPLRYFVFNDDSFKADFTTRVQVAEPHSPRSLGYTIGRWGEWFTAHPETYTPVFFSWALSPAQPPVTVEVLKQENLLK